jgi:cofilin
MSPPLLPAWRLGSRRLTPQWLFIRPQLQADFDAVKNAFLRAQQIKAALDVGLIKPEDYEETKREFLGALAGGVAVSSVGGSNGSAPAAAAKPPQPPPKPVSWSIPPPAPPREQLQQQAAAAGAPAAAPQQQAAPAPPAAAAAPPTAAAAAAAMVAPAAAPARPPVHRVPSNPDVPTNIPKMGGIKQLSQGTSMSGIAVTEDAVNLFYLMRLKATYKWAMWQVDDSGQSVVIAAVGDKQSSWADFLAALPDADCRYGVFDFDFTTPDGQKLHKMIFLNWAPDSARVKAKMMYASTKDFFK